MGDWRRARLVGTFDPDEGKRVHDGISELSIYRAYESESVRNGRHAAVGFKIYALRGRSDWGDDWFWDWKTGRIDHVDLLHERGYDPTHVAEDLQTLGRVAPSMRLVAHIGGEYEQHHCVATVHLDAGRVWIGAPEVPFVGVDIPEELERDLLQPVRDWLRRRIDVEDWEMRGEWEAKSK